MRILLLLMVIVFGPIASVSCASLQNAAPTPIIAPTTAVPVRLPPHLPLGPSTLPSSSPSVTPEPQSTPAILVIPPGTHQPTRRVQLAPTLPPPATPNAPTPQAAAAPFSVHSLERAPMDPVGASLVAWSPDGREILYTGHYNRQALYRFDTQSGRSTEVVHDASTLDYYAIGIEDPLWPTWDHANDAIVYAQHTTTSTADLLAVDRTGKHLRIFAANVWSINRDQAFDAYPNNPPGSLNFDASISENGRVGLLQGDHIVSMRLGEPDRIIALTAHARHQLA